LLRDRGELESARKHCELALQLCQGSFPDSHPAQLPALRLLGSIEREYGELLGATDTFREALRVASAAGLTTHPDALASSRQLSELADASGEIPRRPSGIRAKQLIARTVIQAQAVARRLAWRRRR
jgi:hypothetical protein